MKNSIMEDGVFLGRLSDLVGMILLVADTLIIDGRFVIARRLKHFSSDLETNLKSYSSGSINQDIDITLYIRSRIALKECVDYLAMIYELGYYDTSAIIIDAIELSKSFSNHFEGMDNCCPMLN